MSKARVRKKMCRDAEVNFGFMSCPCESFGCDYRDDYLVIYLKNGEIRIQLIPPTMFVVAI